jgi:hypothetical protein
VTGQLVLGAKSGAASMAGGMLDGVKGDGGRGAQSGFQADAGQRGRSAAESGDQAIELAALNKNKGLATKAFGLQNEMLDNSLKAARIQGDQKTLGAKADLLGNRVQQTGIDNNRAQQWLGYGLKTFDTFLNALGAGAAEGGEGGGEGAGGGGTGSNQLGSSAKKKGTDPMGNLTQLDPNGGTATLKPQNAASQPQAKKRNLGAIPPFFGLLGEGLRLAGPLGKLYRENQEYLGAARDSEVMGVASFYAQEGISMANEGAKLHAGRVGDQTKVRAGEDSWGMRNKWKTSIAGSHAAITGNSIGSAGSKVNDVTGFIMEGRVGEVDTNFAESFMSSAGTTLKDDSAKARVQLDDARPKTTGFNAQIGNFLNPQLDPWGDKKD